VEGRGSDHSEKYGARRGQAKARSKTPGRPISVMENRVKTPGVLRRENPRSVALSKYRAEVGVSSSLKILRGSEVGWCMFTSPRVRGGRGLEWKIMSGETERVLLEHPLVLLEFIIVNPVVDGLKKPSGVKRSRAITSPLPKNRGKRETVDKNELYPYVATRGLQPPVVGGENAEYKINEGSLAL